MVPIDLSAARAAPAETSPYVFVRDNAEKLPARDVFGVGVLVVMLVGAFFVLSKVAAWLEEVLERPSGAGAPPDAVAARELWPDPDPRDIDPRRTGGPEVVRERPRPRPGAAR